MKNTQKPDFRGDFLPDLCNVQAVFHLILVGEILAIALMIAQEGALAFHWQTLGVLSMLIQWIILTSAACLCPLRPWFKLKHPRVAGLASYGLVLLITGLFSAGAAWFNTDDFKFDWNLMATNLVLAALFAGIVLRYFYLQQQLRNQQQAELTARVQALQARIRPHFLFNSMNSIASLIAIDPEAAEDMVVDLSALFRASLNEPGLIPLAQELDLCQKFVAIEQTRLGDRLRVNWSIESIPDAKIPSLMLQPLIENAIYHGIQPILEGGLVEIQVMSKGQDCEIHIRNPVGDKRQTSSKNNGIALENIKHRLSAHYGHRGDLQVLADPTHYWVILKFPKNPPDIL